MNRPENAVGWYHSHPGYGCWLSGIDVSTQVGRRAGPGAGGGAEVSRLVHRGARHPDSRQGVLRRLPVTWHRGELRMCTRRSCHQGQQGAGPGAGGQAGAARAG